MDAICWLQLELVRIMHSFMVSQAAMSNCWFGPTVHTRHISAPLIRFSQPYISTLARSNTSLNYPYLRLMFHKGLYDSTSTIERSKKGFSWVPMFICVEHVSNYMYGLSSLKDSNGQVINASILYIISESRSQTQKSALLREIICALRGPMKLCLDFILRWCRIQS